MALDMAYMDSFHSASRRGDRGESRQVQSYIRPVLNAPFCVRAIMENARTGGQLLKSGLEGLVMSRPGLVPV